MIQKQSLLVIILCCMAALSTAQTRPAATTWTNRVSRVVYIGDSVIDGKKQTNTLAERLTMLAQSSKVIAYSTFDSKMTTKLTSNQLKEMISSVDSVEIEDPVTSQKFWRVNARHINYADIHYFRVLEEWAFDADNAAGHIQIVGVCPLVDQYGEDGSYRGHSAMYWLKYEDVKDVIEQDAREHPERSLYKAVWNNYFAEESTNKK